MPGPVAPAKLRYSASGCASGAARVNASSALQAARISASRVRSEMSTLKRVADASWGIRQMSASKEAGLSFLGVGVQPPTASLGRMIGDGRDHLVNAWWISGVPALVIVAITLLFQIIGDALRDHVDEWRNG